MSAASKDSICPSCGEPMWQRARNCRKCSHGGRPANPSMAYALELGISLRKLRALGGEQKLRAMSTEARGVLLGPQNYGNSQTIMQGGLKARGMMPRTKGYLIPPQVAMAAPLEVLLGDEDVLVVEGVGE